MAAPIIACPGCGVEHPGGGKFCSECGSPLPLQCSACGTISPPGKKFCAECGAPLGAKPPDAAPVPAPPIEIPEQERRLVTVLFADLVGSTRLGEALDPEEVAELLAPVYAALGDTVKGFGGHVAKYLGDGLMAIFGAPVAREDDAERAVLAGLAMHDEIAALNARRDASSPALELRVGITSGEVVAGSTTGQYDVTGDAANTAARLQSAADTGGVLVGEETMRLTRRRIRYGERRALTLKGKAGPVGGYPALGLGERVAERWELHERQTPFVGRDRELASVLAAWQQAAAGSGILLHIVAEAGGGKSRLLAESIGRILQESNVPVYRARSLSYTAGVSLGLVAGLVRSLLDLPTGENAVETRDRIRDALVHVLEGEDAETLAIACDVLGEALGLPPGSSPLQSAEPEVRRRALVRSLRLLLASPRRAEPALVVLEDLHWMDEASAEVLGEALTALDGLGLLVVTTRRTLYDVPGDLWNAGTILELPALEPEAGADLVRAVFGGRAITADLETQLLERAGGNPFFLEELALSVIESDSLVEVRGKLALKPGAAEALPWELTDVLMARIDRLDPEPRAVAQTGSVVGRNFAVRLLGALTGQTESALRPPLDALDRADIAHPRTEPELEYAFKHATLRDVTYGTLTLRRRRDLHGRTARTLLDLYGDERVEIIAYHFARTEEHAEAARWLERAGDRAAEVYANAAARGDFMEAEDRLRKVGAGTADLARVVEKRGRVLAAMGEYGAAIEALEQAASLYVEAGDPDGECRAVARIGHCHRTRATPQDGISRIEPLLSRLSEEEISPARAALLTAHARLLTVVQRSEEELAAIERTRDLAEASGDVRTFAEASMVLSNAYADVDRAVDALRMMETAAELAERAGDLDTLSIALNNLAVWYMDMADAERSYAYRLRALQLAERVGEPARHAFQVASLGWAEFLRGDWQEARRLLDQAEEMVEEIGTSWWSTYPLLYRGGLAIDSGETDIAAVTVERAIACAEASGDERAARYAHCLLAQQLIQQGRAQEARDDLLSLFAGSPLDEPDVSIVLPTLAWVQLEVGDLVTAQATVTEAVRRCREEPAYIDLVDALRVSGMLLAAQDRREEAESAFTEARELARRLKYPYGEARAQYDYGRVQVYWGRHEAARELLEPALAVFERLGALPYITLTRQELAHLGKGSPVS